MSVDEIVFCILIFSNAFFFVGLYFSAPPDFNAGGSDGGLPRTQKEPPPMPPVKPPKGE